MDRIDHLRIFIRVADCRSFVQAADQLGLPRASVTTAIQLLEARIGARLLNRTTRRVSLTQDGEALLERARTLVADMEELEHAFQPSAGSLTGRIRVDLPSRIARRFVAPALPGFLARHPGLSIDLGSSDRTIDLVREGVDCALRVGTLATSSLVARPLGLMTMINCASPDYLARHGTPRASADLAGHVAVDYLPPGGGRAVPWEWMENGEPRTMTIASRVGANNAESYIACALAGVGLIQIPAFDVRHHLETGALVRVLADADPAPMPVHIVYPHRRHLSRRLQAFIGWIEALMAPHLTRPPGPDRATR